MNVVRDEDLAQLFAGLSAISRGRVIMGLGLGGFPQEFAAAGYPSGLHERAELVRANIEICRRLWFGERVSFKDAFFDFAEVALKPVPETLIPIWIGGGTPAACRRAVETATAGCRPRITLATFAKLRIDSRELCDKAGNPVISEAVMPFASVAKDRKTALSKINIESLIGEADKYPTWVKPPSGTFSTLDDILGYILSGTPADIARETRAY